MAERDYNPVVRSTDPRTRHQIDANELRRVADDVHEIRADMRSWQQPTLKLPGAPAEPFDRRPTPCWGRITGAPNAGGTYPWVEQLEDSGGLAGDSSTGRVGTTTSIPAIEVNGNLNVPVGAIVRLFPAGSFDHYLFSHTAAPAVLRLTSGTPTGGLYPAVLEADYAPPFGWLDGVPIRAVNLMPTATVADGTLHLGYYVGTDPVSGQAIYAFRCGPCAPDDDGCPCSTALTFQVCGGTVDSGDGFSQDVDQLLPYDSACTWEIFGVLRTITPSSVLSGSLSYAGGAWTLTLVYNWTHGDGLIHSYSATYTIGAPLDCAAANTFTRTSSTGGTWPATVTVDSSVATCGGGSGPGVGADCCIDHCGGTATTVTITAKVGCFTSVPDTVDYQCVSGSLLGSEGHHWQEFGANFGACFSPITTFIGCVAGVPTWIYQDGSGSHTVTAEAGYTCEPMSAVFLVDDGAGNSCTITAVEA